MSTHAAPPGPRADLATRDATTDATTDAVVATDDAAVASPEPRDRWLLPIVERLAGAEAARRARDAATDSVWAAAVRLGVATDGALVEAVGRHFGVPVADLRAMDPHGRDVVPEAVARRYRVVPVRVSRALVEIATSDPTDVDGERAIAFAAGRRVRLLVAAPSRIAERLDALYAADAGADGGPDGGGAADAGGMARIVDSVAERYEPAAATAGAPRGDDDDGAAAPVVRLVDRLVADAIAARASDVHLEPEEGGVAVRLRVDGVLREVLSLPRAVGLPLVSRVKIMSGLDIADRLRPQDGRARVHAAGRGVDLRVSTLPAAHGEKVVIRILDAGGATATFDAMGSIPTSRRASPRCSTRARAWCSSPAPPDPGKTTTLNTALRAIQARGGVNVVTVEDPVEYRLPGIVQVQVHEKAGLTFAAALRSILRQDPDVVLVGEIRDRETAAIAVQASLTGHLVLSTLHTTDAVGAITRLADVGVEPYKLGAALRGVVAQRLVRRLCAACRREEAAPPAALAPWVPAGAATWAAGGCGACGGTGYRGRLPVMEVLVADAAVARGVAEGVAAPTLADRARAAGMRTLWESGVRALLRGDTSADELLRVLDRPVDAPARTASPSSSSSASVASAVLGEPAMPGVRAPRILPPDPSVADDSPSRGADGERGGAMTELRVGVVDVFVVHPAPDGWRVLLLRRAPGVRCTGAWEVVHGSVEPGERPPDAALREVREETGLVPTRLYNLTAHPFYLHGIDVVQVAVAFVAFVDAAGDVVRGEEHDAHAWLGLDEACARVAWPRARANLRDAHALLRTGDAGPVEDVLRVR